jgi:hypothetical protein
VDQDGDQPLFDPVGPGRLLIVDFVDVLYFEEVVARAQSSELGDAALVGPLGDLFWIGTG